MVIAVTEKQQLLCGYYVEARGESYSTPFRNKSEPYELSEDDRFIGEITHIITLFRLY